MRLRSVLIFDLDAMLVRESIWLPELTPDEEMAVLGTMLLLVVFLHWFLMPMFNFPDLA